MNELGSGDGSSLEEVKRRMSAGDLKGFEEAKTLLSDLILKTTNPAMAGMFVMEIGLGLIGASNMDIITPGDIDLILDAVKFGTLKANAVAMKYSSPDPQSN